MSRRTLITAFAALVALASCQQGSDTGQAVGSLTGAAAGGVAGSQVGRGNGQLGMIGLGVLLGGWAGNEVGKALDQTDRFKDHQAERRAFIAPVGTQVTWKNPDSGNSGTITPVHDGYSDSGIYCREFQQTVTVDGQQKQGKGKACQQADGSWKSAP